MTTWKSVYKTKERYKAEIVKDVLEDHGISAVMVNKQDSSYVIIGELEIHVPVDNVMQAIKIINDDINFK
ncbi:MAG: putative signal transducing protein [Candidatus Cyclobacteriaceae bacterium M2_1C_046]